MNGLNTIHSSAQSAVLHTRIVLSSLWEARNFPRGSQHSPFTKFECPERVRNSSGRRFPFQIIMLLSTLQLARYLKHPKMHRNLANVNRKLANLYKGKLYQHRILKISVKVRLAHAYLSAGLHLRSNTFPLWPFISCRGFQFSTLATLAPNDESSAVVRE